MAEWLAANDSFRRDILATLEADGPLLSRDIPDTSVVPWPSTGWTNNRNITKMLEAVPVSGTAASAFGAWADWPVAGKTGTAQENTNV